MNIFIRPGQPLLSDTVRQRRLSFFGHLCRAVPTLVKTTPELSGPAFGVLPKTEDWRRTGRPRQMWLRTVEDDLRPLKFGLAGDGKTARYGYTGMASILVDAATSS